MPQLVVPTTHPTRRFRDHPKRYEKKEDFNMATWGLIDEITGNIVSGSTNYFAPPAEIPSGHLLTYLSIVPARSVSGHPIINYGVKNAQGSATMNRRGQSGNLSWDIRVKGKNHRAVSRVINVLENKIGAIDLNPPLTLPDNLETVYERIKHLVSWIFGR